MIRSLSRNQRLFAVVATVLSVAYFVFLYRLLDQSKYTAVTTLAVVFGLSMLTAGLVLGGTDRVVKSRTDLGFGYHAITFAVVAPIGVTATLLHGASLWPQLAGLAGWAFGLAVHCFFSRRTLKGIARDEAFP